MITYKVNRPNDSTTGCNCNSLSFMQRNLRHIWGWGHDALPSPSNNFFFWGGDVSPPSPPRDLRHWLSHFPSTTCILPPIRHRVGRYFAQCSNAGVERQWNGELTGRTQLLYNANIRRIVIAPKTVKQLLSTCTNGSMLIVQETETTDLLIGSVSEWVMSRV